MKRILHIVFVLSLILAISACGDNGGNIIQTSTQNNTQVALEVDKSVVVADGTDGITLTVTVRDSTGFPLAQQEILFNVPLMLSFSNTPLAPLITDENGQVVLFLCPTIRLQHDVPLQSLRDFVTATSLGSTSNAVEITINPGPSTPTGSVTFTSDKTQAVADNRDSITFTATVKDTNGAPIPDQLVHFAVSGGNGYAVIALRYTNVSGRASFSYRYPTTQFGPISTDLTFNAKSGGVASNLITVTYTKPVTAQVSLVADKIQAIANGTDTITFTATVYDAGGYPIPYQNLSLTVSPGTNRFMLPGYTDVNGKAVIRLTAPTSTLSDKIINVTATSGGVASNLVSVTYTAPQQVTPALVTLTSDKTTMLADGNDRITFTITAYDSGGLPLAGQMYHLNLPPGPYAAATNIFTNTSGQGLSSLMYNLYTLPKLTSPTTISITATVNGTVSNAINITTNLP